MEADDGCHYAGEFDDGDVSTGADVDMFVAVIVLQKVHESVGGVITEQ
jgi:hypothetical protein